MDAADEDVIGRLERRLERERRARLEAESLLESKSRELFIALEDLRAEADRSRALIDAMAAAADGIALTDAQGIFTYMNKAHAELFGYTPDELIGRPWSVLYTEDVAKRIAEVAMPVVFESGSWRGEASGVGKSGDGIEQEVALTARPDSQGLICVTRDAAERKQREARMRELEHRLRQGEKNAALYLLSNTIAHDLGNLIAVIESNTVAGDTELPADILRERMKRIEAATDSARRVIESMESGVGRDMHTEHSVNLTSLVEKNIDLIRSIKPEGVALATDIAPGARTKVNDVLLARSILNIAKNAFEVMGDQGSLDIRLIPSAKIDRQSVSMTLGTACPDPEWVIEIRDTGPGFPEHDLPSFFEPFASTKTEARFSGLGLLSVRALAESWSASVEIETRLGHGTLFRILIPPAVRAHAGQRAGRDAGKPSKILVVEDEIAIGEQLAAILKSDGYDVSFLADSQLAHDVLTAGSKIDLVVTDLNMPSLAGDALARRVREQRPDLPFILVSSGARYVVDTSLFADRLRKPVDAAALKAAVQGALSS